MSKYNADYKQLLTLYVKAVESTKGIKLPSSKQWITSVEPLAVKLFYHVGSVYYLCEGTKIGKMAGLDINYIDHSSTTVLTRCAFETYLTFYYIFLSTTNDSEKRFRHKIWQLSALCEQEKTPPFLDSIKKHLRIIKKRKAKLIKIIQRDTVFMKLEKNKQKQAIKGRWRSGHSWTDLAGHAGFNKEVFRGLYSYLSEYAHTGQKSSQQINNAIATKDQQMLTDLSKTTCMILISHFVLSYSKMFPQCGQVLIDNPELSEIANTWAVSFDEFWSL